MGRDASVRGQQRIGLDPRPVFAGAQSPKPDHGLSLAGGHPGDVRVAFRLHGAADLRDFAGAGAEGIAGSNGLGRHRAALGGIGDLDDDDGLGDGGHPLRFDE